MNAGNQSLHALSGAYVVDALDDHERAQFEQHLPGCADCQDEVASLREAAAAMADEAALTPPESLRASVLAGITGIRPLAPEVPSTPAPEPAREAAPAVDTTVVPFRRRRSFRVASLAVAAAVLAAAGAGAVFQPWQDEQSPPAAVQTPAERVLAAEDAVKVPLTFEDGSQATVVRSVSERKAVLVTTDMAAPPSGKVFELWLQDEQGTMVPAGLMDSGGDHTLLLKGDASAATAVGITVEPQGGSQRPTSEPLALFDLEKAST